MSICGGGISGYIRGVRVCVCVCARVRLYMCLCLCTQAPMCFRNRKEEIGDEVGKISKDETEEDF